MTRPELSPLKGPSLNVRTKFARFVPVQPDHPPFQVRLSEVQAFQDLSWWGYGLNEDGHITQVDPVG